ncbi:MULTISPECIES: MerR family transcriptional regulator [Streptomyces]|uniref:MerR family transcriptional regulator n=1 Tax=Streptomyces lycii TaxID=2654337 RepID=A0ABQ7FQ32_9ACTN|nr:MULTISPECIES: MerR family transcriptional regulator [Streptomyces]KAF4409343.1 MerR family transcriptional regulator [Streptomyces lycii]PGH47021.1 MerR family transcriptional regulator [Streptomyces sp. Ru87]
MRIGELSRRTGVPVATIKYYVREGLLPAGRLTSPNQAAYDDTHEHRLRLIRALLDVGGLSVSSIRDVLEAVDDRTQPVHEVLGWAAKGILGPAGVAADPAAAAARDRVAGLIERRGWQVAPESPPAEALAEALAALDRVGHGVFVDAVLEDYADAAEDVARVDLEYVGRHGSVEDMVESVVVGTVLGEAVLAALRRLAHVHASARRYGAAAVPPAADGSGAHSS